MIAENPDLLTDLLTTVAFSRDTGGRSSRKKVDSRTRSGASRGAPIAVHTSSGSYFHHILSTDPEQAWRAFIDEHTPMLLAQI